MKVIALLPLLILLTTSCTIVQSKQARPVKSVTIATPATTTVHRVIGSENYEQPMYPATTRTIIIKSESPVFTTRLRKS